MEEYHLTPAELIAKAFRIIQSSRRGYGKGEWIAAVKKVYGRVGGDWDNLGARRSVLPA
jgi:hypothetical protein